MRSKPLPNIPNEKPANVRAFCGGVVIGQLVKLTRAQSEARHEVPHRLVKAPKSPTTPERQLERAFARHQFLFESKKLQHCAPEPLPPVEVEPKPVVTPKGQTGCSTVIQYRDWSDEWRIRTQVETANNLPPQVDGERITEMLSQRGAKKIAESCEYMSLKKGGFKTFVTGTFNEATRARIAANETTIQREVSRCMDAMQKMYRRGWTTEEGERVPGHAEGLSYCWVVEVPKNEQGEENPHVHMLLGWAVPFAQFRNWAARIEGIWGNGYFHMEKIKDCRCAGAYMAKALGYMTKGQEGSQGKVRGNRYGISEPARAPDWVTIGKKQLHAMGQIIADVYDHITQKYGADYRERKQLNKKLGATPKNAKATRYKIGKRLQAVRDKLSLLPIRCNKYQVILKGEGAQRTFLSWALGDSNEPPEWLPELPRELAWEPAYTPEAKDGHYWRNLDKAYQHRKRQFQEMKQRRHAVTDEVCAWIVEQAEQFNGAADSAWAEYADLDW